MTITDERTTIFIDLMTGTWGDNEGIRFLTVKQVEGANFDQMSDNEIAEYAATYGHERSITNGVYVDTVTGTWGQEQDFVSLWVTQEEIDSLDEASDSDIIAFGEVKFYQENGD